MSYSNSLKTGLLLLIVLCVSNSLLAQKKVNVRQTFLPNSNYTSVIDVKSTTVLRYFDEQKTPAPLVETDTTVSSSHISSTVRTGNTTSDGSVPLAIVYQKVLMYDSESPTKTVIPKDAVIYGQWINNGLQLDSITSDSLTSLKEFKLRQTLYGFYEQVKQQEIVVTNGQKTRINRTFEFPSDNGPIVVNCEYNYELIDIKGDVATISLVASGDLPELLDSSMKSISINCTGTMRYHIKNQTLEDSIFNMTVLSTNSRNNVGMELQMNNEFKVSNILLK